MNRASQVPFGFFYNLLKSLKNLDLRGGAGWSFVSEMSTH